MADGIVGRSILVKKGSAVIAGVRTATLSWAGESINVTAGEDNGYRLLLAASGEETLDISIEGIMRENTFRDIALSGASKMLTDITIEWPLLEAGATTPAELSGNFRLSSIEEGAPYNDAVTFTATLESSGAWTYTAEA